eukprot:CAMPEP_0113829918 /NCGR_PEP_ID=MMETSP0328-20130328/6056_1 /TAXON_ID=39455 /ORGANISM="Alexandrium minutum" /LENGTH=56 /DNA_ID=CAMNT_0000798005 /DNA_START=70 /DNA_END=241 /DNA_ORIENTATION=+ /assembly_acc=CAM_ASM_000350
MTPGSEEAQAQEARPGDLLRMSCRRPQRREIWAWRPFATTCPMIANSTWPCSDSSA